MKSNPLLKDLLRQRREAVKKLKEIKKRKKKLDEDYLKLIAEAPSELFSKGDAAVRMVGDKK